MAFHAHNASTEIAARARSFTSVETLMMVRPDDLSDLS
jgi:hypothetical protein